MNIMTRLVVAAVCRLLFNSPLQAASTYRCGSRLVSLDDSAFEVLNTCGEPASRQSIGYKLQADDYGWRQEVSVEEWIYGPKNGMYHYLRFEGNRLRQIDSKRGN